MPTRLSWRADLSDTISRLRALFADGSDSSLARRLAGAAFLIRVVSALLAFISQILLARWMGGFDFGIYIYAWTWVLLIGGMVDLGLGSASQRFIPEYTEHRQFALLRGYLRGSRFLARRSPAPSRSPAPPPSHCSGPISAPRPPCRSISPAPRCRCSALGQVLSGIARSYDWVNLGLAPTYVLRQIVLFALMGLAYALGLPTDATTATLLGVAALWSVSHRPARGARPAAGAGVAKGPQAYAVRAWLAVSAPIFVVEAFYLLLTYSDVIVLKQFRPPDEVAIYYAAAKTLALVAFIYFSVAQTIAHKFAGYHVSGDRKGLTDFLKLSIRLTFWPSLVLILILLALGKPMLRLFGNDFVSGYYLMFIIAIGLLARAAVGPAERLLNMLGERRSCALVYAGSFFIRSRVVPRAHPLAGDRRRRDRQRRGAHLRVGEPVLVAKYRLGFALPDFRAVGALRPGHGGQSVGHQAPVAALGGAASAITSARRAALADRYAAGSLDVEWRSLAELESIGGEWRELAARALEPNVFYEPAFALAAAPVFGRGVGALLVWSGADPRRLLGFFPARDRDAALRHQLPVLVGWSIPMRRSACRLIEREAAEPVIAACLAHLAATRDAAGAAAAAAAAENGPFAAALERSCGARRCPPPISIAIAGRCWRRAATDRTTSNRR